LTLDVPPGKLRADVVARSEAGNSISNISCDFVNSNISCDSASSNISCDISWKSYVSCESGDAPEVELKQVQRNVVKYAHFDWPDVLCNDMEGFTYDGPKGRFWTSVETKDGDGR
jgi:hypothetical protein